MTTPTVIRATACRCMPWKNGGGETTEIAVHPPGADLAGFTWRVSMAGIKEDGPFSIFPGIDRTLALLDGAGLLLTVGTAVPIGLTTQSAPLSFPADAPCAARLVAGPVTDLNVMSRRGVVRHAMHRLALTAAAEIATADTTLVVCLDGAVTVEGLTLERYDTLRSSGPGTLSLAPQGPLASVMVILLWTIGSAASVA